MLGTSETVEGLVHAANALEAIDSAGPPPIILSSSRIQGGKQGHSAHQSGRDVDVQYFRVGGPDALARIETIDLDRTWWFLNALFETGNVQAVFIDYEIQGRLFDRARVLSGDQTKSLFQYPGGSESVQGLIRHSPGHRLHFHVRFRCPKRGRGCRAG